MSPLHERLARLDPASPSRPAQACREAAEEDSLRDAVRLAVGRFCEGSENGLDLGSRFDPGTSPLAVAEAVAKAILAHAMEGPAQPSVPTGVDAASGPR